MSGNRRISEIFHAARSRAPGDRAAFLANLCGSDEALRQDVESLLAHAADADSFLEVAAVARATDLISIVGNESSPWVGRQLGSYTIEGALGAGGMGEVYRAHDARLGRPVAIKMLPSDFSHDRDRLARFEREARLLASFNHPHIAQIYTVVEVDGVVGLVMELVDGTTLADQIARGTMPVAGALGLARQIAQALAAAHEKGVIHRDLKPANVMVTETGQAKILDFGIARHFERAASASARTQAASLATGAGVVMGTLGYMSPEQARAQPVDVRSDIFSFGAVFYEMLAGRPAFQRATALETLMVILEGAPTPLSTLRPEIPREVEALVRACLARDRGDRPSASDLVTRLTALHAAETARSSRLARFVRQPLVAAAAIVSALALVGAGWLWARTNARVRWARDTVPAELTRLVELGDIDRAYRLAHEALAVLPDDLQLRQGLVNVSVPAAFTSTPTGAQVLVRVYSAVNADWIPLGRTPIEDVRVPFGPLRVRMEKEGFGPLETPLLSFKADYVLDPLESRPAGMVRVRGTTSRVETVTARLSDYWMDRFEVTNAEFKRFVDGGGYRSRQYWTQPFVTPEGRALSWEQAMLLLRDATGRPGPSTWELGTYHDGQDSHPVTGVSWYEAVAYAAFVGKVLPTALHWRGAVRNDSFNGNFADILTLSNFGLKGTAPVGSHQGLGAFGTYDMAGNVKEWCWNETPEGRMLLGGGWNEPRYMFQDRDAQPPLLRLPTYGFRLAKYIDAPPEAAFARIVPPSLNLADTTPVDDSRFEAIKNLYAYDATPLNAKLDATEEARDWVRETVSYDAAYGGERITAYLYRPRTAAPPYQAVVYFPGGDAPLLRSSRDLRLMNVDFVIRGGRALLYPIYKGTYERSVPITGVNAYRDLTIARTRDVARSVDYLLERRDIDHGRIGAYGVSLGAIIGTIFTGIDDRLRASVLMGGGVGAQRGSPEIDPLNFAPRVRVPTLLIGGRSDFSYPLETSQRPLFQLFGVPASSKRHAVFEGGHVPLRMQDVIREVLDWFDRFLGPVTPPK